MWIDSICIDQGNTDEQSDQVVRMKDIYRLADRVVIWLGPAGPDTHLAFEGLRSLGDRVETSRGFIIMPPPLYAGEYSWVEPTCGLSFSDATWTALETYWQGPGSAASGLFKRACLQTGIPYSNVETPPFSSTAFRKHASL